MGYALILSAVTLFAVSCQKNEEVVSFRNSQTKLPLTGISDFNTRSQDDARIIFAKTLAKAMKEQTLREFIKEKSLLDMDGENGILYQAIKNESVGKEPLYLLLSKYALNDFSSYSQEEIQKFFLNITDIDPYLTIMLPTLENIDPSSWNTKSPAPVAVSINQEISAENGKVMVQQFDSEGNSSLISKKEDPNQMVIVVKENERIVGVNMQTEKTISGNDMTKTLLGDIEEKPAKDVIEKYVYNSKICNWSNSNNPSKGYKMVNKYTIFDLYNGKVESKASNSDNSNVNIGAERNTCPRDTKNNHDEIVSFRLKGGWSSWLFLRDSWVNNNVELFVILKRFQFSPAYPGDITKAILVSNKLVIGSRSKGSLLDCSGVCTGKVNNLPGTGMATFNWNKIQHGEECTYSWIEEDKGDPIEVTTTTKVKFKGVEISRSMSIKWDPTKDDELGDGIADYCNPNALIGALHDA